MITIDRKFVIIAVNPCKKGTRFLVFAIRLLQKIAKLFRLNANTEKTGFFFKASDAYSVAALNGYIDSMNVGLWGQVDESQIACATLLRNRVVHYQRREGSHVPGIEGYCETDRCIGGIGVDEE